MVSMHYWAYLWLVHSMKFSGHWLRSAWYQVEKLGQRIGHLAIFFFFFLLSFFLCHNTLKFQEVKRGRSFAFCWQLTHNDSSFTKISVDVTSCHVFRDRVTFRVLRRMIYGCVQQSGMSTRKQMCVLHKNLSLPCNNIHSTHTLTH